MSESPDIVYGRLLESARGRSSMTTAVPEPGDEFTDDQGETRIVASVEECGDELIIHDSFGDAVIVPSARFEARG